MLTIAGLSGLGAGEGTLGGRQNFQRFRTCGPSWLLSVWQRLEPYTLYQDIRALPAGTTLLVKRIGAHELSHSLRVLNI